MIRTRSIPTNGGRQTFVAIPVPTNGPITDYVTLNLWVVAGTLTETAVTSSLAPSSGTHELAPSALVQGF